ncbi:hypothetical protein AKJ39_02140 [candidate division MSBL1 archaeon SCGC-AAA259J03]|uniref:DUF3887 domain-containing protein n=1 Tax=candidate division MSBL1 archaeon SCGC-AAA259J03 TaxID=1698269 RepID=A0A656YWA3_9EURY|nr:hypothetical protein AKJ39_02140 [candidate division MSBL1 archaeon SCGC-AAA259J03]
MKKILIVLSLATVLCFSSANIVHAERPYQNISDSFFTGLESGDYSKFEPYLSNEMKEAFDEETFDSFRNDLFSKYGQLDNYQFVKEDSVKQDQVEYTRAYYDVSFEKAVVTLRLVFRETNSGYELAGIWTTNVKGKGGGWGSVILSNLPTLAFSIIGAVLALLLFYYLLRFEEIKIVEILIGIFLAVVTIIVQPNIQNIPFLVLGIKSNSEIIARGIVFTILSIIYLGFVAGIFQEGIRYPLARKKAVKTAAFIGLGFGLGEAIIIPILGLMQAGAPLTSLPFQWSFLNLTERFLVTAFHGCTTAIMAYAYKNGWGLKALAGLILAHGGIDTIAVYYQLAGSQLVLALTLITAAIIAVGLLYYVLKRMREDRQQETEKMIEEE